MNVKKDPLKNQLFQMLDKFIVLIFQKLHQKKNTLNNNTYILTNHAYL